MGTTRPHDLLRVSGPAALPDDAPEWARYALRTTPWVVVRRAAACDGLVPVGVRGTNRSERYGTLVALGAVREAVAPEALVDVPGRDLPAIRALRSLRPLLDDIGLAWGPTGSVGFELATGQPVVTTDSDVDILVRTSDLGRALPALTRLSDDFRIRTPRVDCQVETTSGAAALTELLGGRPTVMVRTMVGPRLVERASIS